MNNALLYLGGLLVMTLALVFAVPYFVDWNSYRGVFEEEASRVLGREVRVGGTVNLRLLPSPYVRFDKIRIADSTGDGGSSIFRADSFTMWLSVPPLLRGVLEANRVELKRPVLQLATDKSGSGNWRTLAINPGVTPFLPTDVALQSVEIIDGIVAYAGPNWNELARFEDINGELVAEALEGPYKFKGTLKAGGGQRAVRIATAPADKNGDVRFKASVDAVESQNSYVLDGRLSDLLGTPHLEGDLDAKLRLGLKPTAAEGAAAAEPAPASSDATPLFDLRAKVNADATSLKLTDVAVTLEQGGTPQLITGSGKLDWADKIHLDVALASSWLDLDALAGAGASPVPLQSARAFFENLAALLPAEADTEATLDFDQLNLGGEALGNVHLAASRAGGPLKLTGLRANLPGGTHLDLDGVLTTAQKSPRFDGDLALSGQSLLRFLSWGLREKRLGEGRADGPFAIEGQFGLGEDSIELTEASAEIEGMPLAGEARLALGARKRLTLALAGARIDAGQIHPGLLDPAVLGSVFFAAAPPAEGSDDAAAPPAPGALGFLDPANTDLSVKLKVAEIVDGSRSLRDVNAEIGLERGRLSVPLLKFSTPDGLAIEAGGDANGLPAKPDGTMRALISAPSPAAAQSFADLFGMGADAGGPAARIADLAPVRLAGSFAFHADRAPATEITLDGTMQGGRVRATARLDGAGTEWRLKPVDITATAESPDVARTLVALFGGNRAAGDQTAVAKPGHFVVRATGTPASGMLSLASATGEGLSLEYNGRITVPQADTVEVGGEVRVAVADAKAALDLAGLGIGSAATTVPLDGVVKVARKDGVLTLASDALAAGNSSLRGTVTVAASDKAPRVVTADIETPEATVAGLLAPLVAGAAPAPAAGQADTARVTRTNAIPAEPAQGADAAPIWPDQTFDLGALSNVDGHLKLRVASLAVEPGLSIADARIEAAFGAKGVDVEKFEGKALGGTLVSKLDFATAPAGVELTGSVRIDVASKEPAPDAAPAPGDVVAFNVDFTGRALSPAALINSLTGKGAVALGDASLSGMSPSAVSAVAEAALAGKGPAQGEPLAQAIKTALKQGELKLGKIDIPVELRDGALKLNQVALETADGRATFVTAIELPTMTLDSVWQIEPKVSVSAAPPAAGGDAQKAALLPAVTVVYIGKLKELAAVEPTVTTAALERELTVRKMERDVSELERLRRLDQARAKEEQQRQKALEAERLRNAAVPPQGAPPQSAAPPQGAAPVAPPAPPGPSGAATPADPNAPPADAAAAAPVDPNAPPADPNAPPGGSTANAVGPDGLPAASAEAVPPTDAPRPRKRRAAEPWKPWSLTPY